MYISRIAFGHSFGKLVDDMLYGHGEPVFAGSLRRRARSPPANQRIFALVCFGLEGFQGL